MYKYSCRKCPIRDRCIEESDNSSSTKMMVRTAFKARTDTLATWGLLQKNCLLLASEKTRSQSALSDRLRQVQNTRPAAKKKVKPADASSSESSIDTSILSRRKNISDPGLTRTISGNGERKKSEPPDYLRPVSTPQSNRPPKRLKRLSGTKDFRESRSNERFQLVLVSSGRQITLPVEGELILGRFDPNVGIPPDIDLAFEDRKSRLVARRHASIIARNKTHLIQDLGSQTGVYINGQLVTEGKLTPKDRIMLGSVNLVYDKVSTDTFEQARSKDALHILTVTPTSRRYRLPYNRTIVVGRSDPQVNFKPDIDLGRDGDTARLVSRRHVQIYWRYGQLYVEDLGSNYGTKINGSVLSLGQAVPLKPGDHLWLGGCVLAYDVEAPV